MIGTGLAIMAYVPQVVLLLKTRDSTGVSLRSWSLWFVATTFIVLAAHAGDDMVFKTLSASNWMFATVITTLVYAFKPGRKYSRAKYRY